VAAFSPRAAAAAAAALLLLPQVPYKYVDDLATVWCEWAEMELRHNNFKSALQLMRRATEVSV
jgi:lipopolysaccharide biosynthesis regulator YciM